MNYQLLDKIVSEYIRNNPLYISTIDEVEEKSIEILSKNYPVLSSTSWSKKVKLNDAIQYVYEFLLSIDEELTNQFLLPEIF